ncbi:unnamed protein product [Dovyalis caffra]|uniref:Uncharacterized protein n=1 Tax=Dovyalis caffra TaxID=77055 RepID=A0AAV1RWW0_9ROSI|nr:unnamed protein product [Dovyalis caffra]
MLSGCRVEAGSFRVMGGLQLNAVGAGRVCPGGDCSRGRLLEWGCGSRLQWRLVAWHDALQHSLQVASGRTASCCNVDVG